MATTDDGDYHCEQCKVALPDGVPPSLVNAEGQEFCTERCYRKFEDAQEETNQ